MKFLLEMASFNLWDWRWISTAFVFTMTYFVGSFYYRVLKYPRGPFPLPFLGNLLALRNVRDLHSKATEWSQKYGDVFTLWFAHRPMVILNSYAVIRTALLDLRHDFSGRLPSKIGELQTQGDNSIVFENYNPQWKALRKVALLAVRKYAVSHSLEKLCTDVVDAYVGSLKEGTQLVDSRTPSVSIIFKLIGVSMCGTSVVEEGDEVRRLEAINHQFYKISPNGLPSDIAPWLSAVYFRREQKMAALLRDFRSVVYRLFTKAEASYVPGRADNFSHALLAAREEAIREQKSDAEYLTKGNMVQVIINLFGAATDTTAGTLHWLFLWLARDPTIQDKIKKEINDNIGAAPPVYGDREKLPFTVACLLETLRLHPAAPLALPHRTSADTRVGEKDIPNNTGIMYNIYGVNHDPNLWEKPEEFLPERFLDSATGKVRKEVGPSISFGIGARTCPGEKLAHMDLFYVLVRLMQRVTFSAPKKPSNVNMSSIGSSLFLHPAPQSIAITKTSPLC